MQRTDWWLPDTEDGGWKKWKKVGSKVKKEIKI